MDRRAELTEFLKTRRARIRPEDLGLKVFGNGRRRVPGLRREELAQAAGVSADYYVRLEQGRTDNVSQEILDAVAEVLGLTEDERDHLARLAKPVRRPKQRRTAQRVRPAMQQLLNALDGVPAFVLGRRMDVLAWNPLAAALIVDFGALSAKERNMPRLVFLDESCRDRVINGDRVAGFYPQWEAIAAETVDYLRLYAGRNPDDPELAELIGELSIHSEEFRKQWARHDVRDKSFGVKRMVHPMVGELTLQYETLVLPGDPDQLLVTYSAEPGTQSESALRLLASWTAPTVEPPLHTRTTESAPELP
ncbi:helix-turn-helix transcriptional regulator [Kribbella monticola]|uniref:helix-turn-helix transcriptional regulator n=1 Tax=Kribbella monticola TaxID=2185285 RepID=UPI000DD4BC2A|nr:helix-turn-helix transcriptional regulator [Kribbella monticola]